MKGSLRLAPAREDPKFQIIDNTGTDVASEIRENLARKREQVALPDGIFHFHNKAGTNQFCRAGVNRKPLPHRSRPGAEHHLLRGERGLGNAELTDNAADAFHGRESEFSM